MADINVGNNANLLKGAIDSHDSHINNDNRVTNNIVHNTTTHTVYEAQRSQLEIEQANEKEFLKEVRMRIGDGLTRQKEAELDLIARDWHINPIRAEQIIDAERKSAEILSNTQSNGYYTERVLQNVSEAVYTNQIDIIRHLFKSVEELSQNTDDNQIQYYYHMLYASLYPTNCVVSFVSHHTDNYWQYFWTCIAYVKLGQIQKATELISRLGAFGGPHGDIDLLSAVGNLYDIVHTEDEYYKQQLQNNLQYAVTAGMSEQLSPLWYALQEFTKPKSEPEAWFAFYVETTLQELTPQKNKQTAKGTNGTSQNPEMPNYEAQSIQLKQSQGWNPLQAARQMGLGQIPSMSDLQAQLHAMQNKDMNTMPPFPGMSTGINMPQMPVTTQPESGSISAESELVIPEKPQAVPMERPTQYGIIFTDSLALAEKYGCDVQNVYQVLNEFMNNSERIEQYWYLLDVGRNRQMLGNNPYWGDYNEILSKYIEDNGFQTGLATPVFIIGGSDVIPIPQLENPQYSGMIPSDMAYCFYTTFFSDLWDGDRYISEDYVRNTISRLPLECGPMQTSIEDDLLSYFNLCSLAGNGIDMEGVVMASNVEWTANSITMSQHLPLIYTNTNDKEEIYQRMYMCPKLVAADTGECEVDTKVLHDYETALQHAGMLLFNLHGSDSKGQSGFYCRDENGAFPESFNIGLMQHSNARVFNTVACFGARYDGYERNDSMLLSSLFGGGKVLYAGSTVSVPMIPDEDQNYPENVTRHPGSGSEKFMPIYCYYQFCGLPAGQAMMRAKLDYFNTYRHIERDDFSLSTIMMFGLYGNPMLFLKVRQDVINEAIRHEILPQLQSDKAINAPVHMKYKKQLLSKEQLHASKSLLDQLRGCVDEQLTAIHGMVQQNLYHQLGLDPRWLDEVDAFEMLNDSGERLKGYLYNYDQTNRFGRKSIIEVSQQGEITRKITFK